MNLKSLLIGSAAAVVITSGAQAADAVVYAEPEPMEYVRICDVYGAGFFYIPGTETCLKIGGYFRFDVGFAISEPSGYASLARFAPNFDVRSETEWGTLRGYAELELDWASSGGGTETNLLYGFIELTTANGALRIGKGENPYSRYLGFAGLNVIDTEFYPYLASNEISYTFTASNGFSAIIAVLDNPDDDSWGTNVEGGFQFSQGWGSVGLIAGYDGVYETWGLQGAVVGNFGETFSAKIGAYYSDSLDGYYATPTPYGDVVDWSVYGSVSAQFSEKASAALTVQWFNEGVFTNDTWMVQGEVAYTPVENFKIVPSIRYATTDGADDIWAGVVRFQRDF